MVDGSIRPDGYCRLFVFNKQAAMRTKALASTVQNTLDEWDFANRPC
jgi:hypothetical protein